MLVAGTTSVSPLGAARKRWSPATLLERLVADELEDKQRRSVERRLSRARLGRFKPLADWDWNWPDACDRDALERILALEFLAQGENIVLVGAQGPRQDHARQEHRLKRWDAVFPNASYAVALIDRLTHHAEILVIEGQSYRR